MTQDNRADMRAILRAQAVLVNGLDSTRHGPGWHSMKILHGFHAAER